jgi:hypothetical protein
MQQASRHGHRLIGVPHGLASITQTDLRSGKQRQGADSFGTRLAGIAEEGD